MNSTVQQNGENRYRPFTGGNATAKQDVDWKEDGVTSNGKERRRRL